MDDLDKYLNEQMKNPEFKQEWDSHEMEYQLMMMVLKARKDQNMTQMELAERTGCVSPISAGLRKDRPFHQLLL